MSGKPSFPYIQSQTAMASILMKLKGLADSDSEISKGVLAEVKGKRSDVLGNIDLLIDDGVLVKTGKTFRIDYDVLESRMPIYNETA
jgi:hypothetical protein